MDEVSDMASRLLYYDRKECEDIPLDAIEQAIAAGEVSIDEIVGLFRDDLESAFDQHQALVTRTPAPGEGEK
jgi:hypothetical protein